MFFDKSYVLLFHKQATIFHVCHVKKDRLGFRLLYAIFVFENTSCNVTELIQNARQRVEVP